MPHQVQIVHPVIPTSIDHRPENDIRRVVNAVASYYNVPANLIFSNSRSRVGIARARQLAMYLSHVLLGQSMTAVGAAFGRDRTTVSYACGLIEDMRDDLRFDAEVAALEHALEKGGK